jgi:DNA polymerase-3 subunit delta
MVAIKAHLVDGIIKRPDKGVHLFLIYGPDTGLVHERARELAQATGVDLNDPFQAVRLSADDVAADPSRLSDEALTRALFGGQRVVWVQIGAKNIVDYVKPLLETFLSDVRIILEAGDLAKSSPLRTLCEASPLAYALPCYSDAGRDLAAVIEDTVRSHGLRIRSDAREWLIAHLGSDRASTRSELEKLTLYARGETEITLNHVMAVIEDASALQVDDLIDHAYTGNMIAIDEDFARLVGEGLDASMVMMSVLRHLFLLQSLHHHMRDQTPFKSKN